MERTYIRGPWKVCEDYPGTDFMSIDAEDSRIMAEIWPWPDKAGRMAVAHLMAASPRLLEACENLIAECDHDFPGSHSPSLAALERVREAIAEARGEA